MSKYTYATVATLLKFAVYLGTGFVCHAFLLGPVLDFNSAWTWAWLLGWPLMLFLTFGYYFLWFLGICAALFALWFCYMWAQDSLHRRRRRLEFQRRQAESERRRTTPATR